MPLLHGLETTKNKMPIAKIYQDGKYVNEISCKAYFLNDKNIALYEDENEMHVVAYIPHSMMVIFKPDGHVDYDKADKELRERKV